MTSQAGRGHYVAEIIAFEDDPITLLNKVQQHVAGGHAVSGALYKAHFGSHSDAVEKQTVTAANSARRTSDVEGSPRLKEPRLGDLTLTLFSIETTWRFDSFYHRVFSPSLTWPAIRKFFKPGASVESDLILQDSHQSQAGIVVSPPAHILHVEIHRCAGSDEIVEHTVHGLRKSFPSYSRQLLFASDPAQNHAPHKGSPKHVLMQEFDARHTAKNIASTHAYASLTRFLHENSKGAVVRIFSLVGSSTYHDVTPMEPGELKIDNHTHAEKFRPKLEEKESYFGLRPEQYIHL